MNNKTFDKIKKSSLYILPAVAAAYFGLAQIWGFPKGEEVVGSVAVIETLLGVLLGLSTAKYNNSDERFDGGLGVSVPTEIEDGVETTLNISLDPEAVASKDELLLKVRRD